MSRAQQASPVVTSGGGAALWSAGNGSRWQRRPLWFLLLRPCPGDEEATQMAAGIGVRRVLAAMLPVTSLAAVAPLVTVPGALAAPTTQTSPIAATAVQTSSVSISGTAGT